MTHSKILLVGGAGFIGSHLAQGLSADGWNVAIVDRIAPPSTEGRCEVILGDLRDLRLLRNALSRYSRVVYLAHESRTAPAADRLAANFINNVELFLLVLQEAIGCGLEEFTLFSTGGAVYGEPDRVPIGEDAPTNPLSPYGIAKLTMEKYLAMTARSEGFRHLCLRPSNPYGPGQSFTGTQGIVSVSMARIARGQAINILGDGSATKDYIFIDDLVAGVISLLRTHRASGVFNIGTGKGLSVVELLRLISKTIGKEPALAFGPPFAGDVSRNIMSCEKLRVATGWWPRVNIEEGLARTWDWMRPLL